MARLPAQVERTIEVRFIGEAGRRVRAALGTLAGIVEFDRVCWCVLYLGKDDPSRVEYYAEAARHEYREVIGWAEYDSSGRQIRDLRRGLPTDA
ncbi:MAG: hypothetical protein JNL82_23460 [Myxococcales bacterium]|jgi:hypothetical protein|nr:hypothetical protein [Myxococcales bacterium]